MTKVTIIKEGAKINFVPYLVGTVMEIEDDIVGPWLTAGLCRVGEEIPNPPPETAKEDPGSSMSAGVPKKKKVDA
jgi:hypothetical protein